MYGCQIWGQIENRHVTWVIKLQNMAIRIINFAPYQSPSTPLYKSSKILKLSDSIKLQNFLYVFNSLKGDVPNVLKSSFALTKTQHNHNIRGSSYNQVTVPKVNIHVFGIKSNLSISSVLESYC